MPLSTQLDQRYLTSSPPLMKWYFFANSPSRPFVHETAFRDQSPSDFISTSSTGPKHSLEPQCMDVGPSTDRWSETEQYGRPITRLRGAA
jgi:hypothetical protein